MREVLSSHLFTDRDKHYISGWFRSGEGNSGVGHRLSELFSGRAETAELSTGEKADYFTSTISMEINILDFDDNKKAAAVASWTECAALLRGLWLQELDGFFHEPPPLEPAHLEGEPVYAVGDQVVIPYNDHDVSGTIGHIGEIDIRIDTGPYAWSHVTVNKEFFVDALRQDERNAGLFVQEPPALEPAQTASSASIPPVPETVPEHQPEPNSPIPAPAVQVDSAASAAGNFRITDDNLGVGGPREKYKMNVVAIRTLKQIEMEGRSATAAEQEILSRYVGWGGVPDAFDKNKTEWLEEYSELKKLLTPEEYELAIASTLNAHYTSPMVIKAVYEAVENMGFESGKILEPSCGVGNFFGLLPESMAASKLYGVELDSITGRIAQQLYGKLISSFQCDSRTADMEFAFSKRLYATKTGRRQSEDDVIAYQIRQSFVPGEITPEEANRLGYELARRFTKGNHAFIVCTHIDKAHIHNHIIWNSTSLDHKRKFRNFGGSTHAVRRLSDTICIENGYSIVENPKRRGKSYDQWLGGKPPSHRDELRGLIDDALAQNPADLDALLQLLQDTGVTVIRRGKGISLQAPGRRGHVRLDARSLGQDYTLPELMAVLAGEKKHSGSAKNIHRVDPPKVNLLVDVQAKLQAGKGAGYIRWASTFNLKQMAQTLNYLTEHKLLDYADLSKKAAEASADYNDLSEKIKAAEKRMAQIAVLKTHIINYSKTRDVYVAYRKAGYSKAFKAEHESEILLHQAAKKAFDDLGLKKLPSMKELQNEYVSLLAEKKAAYADYRKARDRMKELLTVKANVDRLMGYDKTEPEKDTGLHKEH